MKKINESKGLPIIGGSVIEIGKFIYNMIVILSDHKDPKDQETVIFQYENKEQSKKMRDTIIKEGINLNMKDKGIEVEVFYPPGVIRKIIVRKEPLKAGPGSKIAH